MTDDSRRFSRRRLVGSAATLAVSATAGCLDSLSGSSDDGATPSSNTTSVDRDIGEFGEIEPAELGDTREGTPGEFYALLERNGIEVDSMVRNGNELEFSYYSDAEEEEESIAEIQLITTVYNENLVKNGTDLEICYAEIVGPFDGQAIGWAVRTEWCEQYNGGEFVEDGDADNATDGDGVNETEVDEANETDNDRETQVIGADGSMEGQMLMMNVLNTRAFEDDLE